MSTEVVGAAVDTGGMSSAAPPSIIPEAMAADLVAAWAELSNVHKSKTAAASGKFGGYTYGDLADLLAVARPILAAHNLALIQPLSRQDAPTVTIHTMLVHTSGHVLEWLFDVHGGGSPQETGSVVTYGRRYCATGVLGMAFDDDDDDDGRTAQTAAAHQSESFDDARPVESPLPSAVQTQRVVRLFDQLEIVNQRERREVMAAILDKPERTWAQLQPEERLKVIEALQERVEEALRASSDAVGSLLDE